MKLKELQEMNYEQRTKNKEMQIEEMAEDIENTILGLGIHLCEKSAEKLYDLGYRKLPDGAVILTPEERDEEMKEINKTLAERDELKDRISELEKKIENGTLVELPCKGIEELDIIKKGMIFIFYKICLEQNLGQGVFLKYKSKINEWFKSYLKNKELQEEQE